MNFLSVSLHSCVVGAMLHMKISPTRESIYCYLSQQYVPGYSILEISQEWFWV